MPGVGIEKLFACNPPVAGFARLPHIHLCGITKFAVESRLGNVPHFPPMLTESDWSVGFECCGDALGGGTAFRGSDAINVDDGCFGDPPRRARQRDLLAVAGLWAD